MALKTFDIKDEKTFADYKAKCAQQGIKMSPTVEALLGLWNKYGHKMFEGTGVQPED